MKGQTCTVRHRQERDSEYKGISYQLDEGRCEGRKTDRYRQAEPEIGRRLQRQTETDRAGKTQAGRQTDRGKQRHRDMQTQKDTETETDRQTDIQ